MQLNVMEFSFPNAFDEIPEDRSDEAWLRGSEALRFAAEYTVCLLPWPAASQRGLLHDLHARAVLRAARCVPWN